MSMRSTCPENVSKKSDKTNKALSRSALEFRPLTQHFQVRAVRKASIAFSTRGLVQNPCLDQVEAVLEGRRIVGPAGEIQDSEAEASGEAADPLRTGAQSRAQSDRVIVALKSGTLSVSQLVMALDLRSKTGALKRTINDLLAAGLIEYTIPEKPTNRLQMYRLTSKGRRRLARREPHNAMNAKGGTHRMQRTGDRGHRSGTTWLAPFRALKRTNPG